MLHRVKGDVVLTKCDYSCTLACKLSVRLKKKEILRTVNY